MAFWNKSIGWDPWLARFSRLEERISDTEARVERVQKENREIHRLLGKQLDQLVAHNARVESRSAKVPKDTGGVKEWLPVLARMQEVTLAAMGHADMAQQFGLTDRQREQVQDERPTTWVDAPIPDMVADDDGVTYGA